MKKYPVMLNGKFAWYLFGLAEKAGQTVEEFMRDAIESHLAEPPEPQIIYREKPPSEHVMQATLTRARVIELVRAGWDDGSIAVEVDRVRAYVAKVRRAAGLPPNKRGMVRSA